MPLSKTITLQDGILLIWELSEPVSALISLFPAALTDPVFKKITSPKRQQEWLTIRVLLREAGCTPGQLKYLETGQPRIIHPEYRWISISHSDRFAGLFLHKKHPVGLDLENSGRNFIRVAHKYLSPEEKLLADSFPNGHGLFWCIKEAVYKAAQTPGIHFAEQICIESGNKNILAVSLITKSKHPFDLHYFKMDEQLIAYVIARPNSRNKKTG